MSHGGGTTDDWPTCACGCGLPCPVYKHTDNRRGKRKGEPATWVAGHNAHGRWWVDIPGYRSLHFRLNAARGHPHEHPCQNCGQQARDWAYDGKDPDELIGISNSSTGTTAPYSLNMDHYVPLCRSCHTLLDPNHNRDKTHCNDGHEFTPENTYINPKGSRCCRTCLRRRDAEYRARQKAKKEGKTL